MFNGVRGVRRGATPVPYRAILRFLRVITELLNAQQVPLVRGAGAEERKDIDTPDE